MKRTCSRNPEPGTRNPEPGTRNPEPGTRNPEPGTRNPEPGAMILLRVSANKGNDSLRACVDRMAVRSLVEELRLNPKEEQ
jgi:hypothetical protein